MKLLNALLFCATCANASIVVTGTTLSPFYPDYSQIGNASCDYQINGNATRVSCVANGKDASASLFYAGTYTVHDPAANPGDYVKVSVPFTITVAATTDDSYFNVGIADDGTLGYYEYRSNLTGTAPSSPPLTTGGSVYYIFPVNVPTDIEFAVSASTNSLLSLGHADLTATFGAPTVDGMAVTGSVFPLATPEPATLLLSLPVLAIAGACRRFIGKQRC